MGSLLEDTGNKIRIIKLDKDLPNGGDFVE